MKIESAVQGTQEWMDLRAKYFTASEAPAMLGVSKYLSRADLLKQKSTGLAVEVDANTQALYDRGHTAEAAARPIAEGIIGEELYPATVTAEIDGLPLLASLDGMTMGGDILFEHKLYNESLAGIVRDCRLLESTADLPLHYIMQIEQQLLVSGAEKVIFMCSDGTEERCEWMWYWSNPGHRMHLLNGWGQFIADLAAYEHFEDAPKLEGKAPETLPALRIELTGMVTASNLVEFKRTALAVIDGVNTDLQTDADFADAEKAVKWAKDVEDRLDAAKQHALSQTASIDELFRTLDEIKDYARSKRLNIEKLVKARKESIRVEIMNGAKQALAEHIAKLEQRIKPLRLPAYQADFAGAMKNKRTVASLRDATGTLLAQAKIETSAMADEMEANLKALDEMAGEYRHLFADLQQIASKPADDFAAVVKLRIAEHKDKEEKRLEAERERIREEERASLEREATAHDQRGKAAEATHGEPMATASPQAPVASTSPIKLDAKYRPTDAEIIEVLALHYRVHEFKILEWLYAMNLDTESAKLSAGHI